MPKTDTTSPPSGQLERGAMGTADIVFFVLAGVAPMGVVVALLTLSIALGNGAGVPGTYAVAGVVLALFAAGYVRMSRRIANVGGFYTYARQGLGRRSGGATAYIALLAYNAATIGIFGALAYFASQAGASFGVHISWQVWALIAYAIVAVLAYFEVTMSAKVLGLALAAEVLTLLVFDVAVLARNGFHGFSLDVFKPSVVFAGGFGISLMLAFGSFAGFEATALYGEESRDPHRSVPRATYISLALITVFYLITSWAAISSYGVQHAQAAAAANPSTFIFAANAKYVGGFTTDVMQILVVTSLFAAFQPVRAGRARHRAAAGHRGRRDRRVLPAAPPGGIGLGRDHRPRPGRHRPGRRHGPDDPELQHAHRQHRDLGQLTAAPAACRRRHRRRHGRAPARARALRRRPRPDRGRRGHGGCRALRPGPRQRLTQPRRGLVSRAPRRDWRRRD